MKLELVLGKNGVYSVYLNDHRITGRNTKPLGGGRTIQIWKVEPDDIKKAWESLPFKRREEKNDLEYWGA